MARLVILLIIILHGDARLHKLCTAPFLSPTTFYREGEKPSEYCTLLLPMAGIKPGPSLPTLRNSNIKVIELAKNQEIFTFAKLTTQTRALVGRITRLGRTALYCYLVITVGTGCIAFFNVCGNVVRGRIKKLLL